MNNWYYSLDGQNRVGPISEQELSSLISKGNLSGQTLVWQEGMTQWAYASTINSLFPQNSPPPLVNSPPAINTSRSSQMPPVSTLPVIPSGTVPAEIKGWNWGAFLMGALWGIGNQVWISLLCLVPFVGFFILIYLGVKGNELAWKNGKWNDIQQFKSVQRNWTIAGLICVPLGLFILILASSGY